MRLQLILPLVFRACAVLVCSYLCLSGVLFAQQDVPYDECSGGTLYYIAFPEPLSNLADERYTPKLQNTPAFSLMIYSSVAQRITISHDGEVQKLVNVQAGKIIEQRLESFGLPVVTAINTPVSAPVKVEAEFPIIVYGYMATAYGCGAYSAIPVESWGTEYFAATWPGEIVRDVQMLDTGGYLFFPKPASPEILIIAASDNTEVNIQATASLKDCDRCYNVVLNAGEVYRVQSIVDADLEIDSSSDLGGTRITATKPIGVISGNNRLLHYTLDLPLLAQNAFKDMVVEWIPPVNQHGTEFVFLPTFDERRIGGPADDWGARGGERVRLYSTQKTASIEWFDSIGHVRATTVDPVPQRKYTEERIERPVARAFQSSEPALAMMSPEFSWEFSGVGCTSYLVRNDAWSTYMAELVPREQWTSFTPFRVPARPTDMKHYLNVVTEAENQSHVFIRKGDGPAELFVFNQGAVPGTDYVWGSIPVEPDQAYYVSGENGTEFSGNLYGIWKGKEELYYTYPAKVRSEYSEDLSLSYGFPLAPSRCALLGLTESAYKVETEYGDCGEMTVRILTEEDTPPGIRSIELLEDSTHNVRLELVTPSDPVTFKAVLIDSVILRIVPVNPSEDAFGVLIVKDRSRDVGRIRVEYRYEAEKADVTPKDRLDFGVIPIGTKSGEKEIVIANPLNRSLSVKYLDFVLGNMGFQILRTEPSFDWSSGIDSVLLDPGQSIKVWVDVQLRTENRTFVDTLVVDFGCVQQWLEVVAVAGVSCINVDNLDFSTVSPESVKILHLEICNTGNADLVFRDSVLTWSNAAFAVNSVELERLKSSPLSPGQCTTIPVKFIAQGVGQYQAVARFWSDSWKCINTSVWQARVVDTTTSVAGDKLLAGYEVSSVTPNPTSGKTTLTFQLGHSGITTVKVYDTEGRVIATLADERLSAGEHRVEWDGAGQPSGTYYIRIQSGEWTGTARIMLVR